MGKRSPGWLGAAALAGLAACGRLSTPDLLTGRIEGRLLGAAPAGASVYVLGAPDRGATVAADGSFAVERVPAGTQRLVLFDGVSRAEISAPVEVRGGMRSRLSDRDAAAMPLAGRIAAAVRPGGGALPAGALFTVDGTVYRDRPAGVTGPLPAGSWPLTARMGGYRTLRVEVSVQPGLTAEAELALDVDDGDERRGCLSSTCPPGLHCSGADGQCYACTDTSQCGSDDFCDAATHTCVEGAANGDLCESATAPGQCASGQMAPGNPYGYCTVACTGPADCPAGWRCDGSGFCQVSLTCRDVRTTFGSPCLRDDACAAGLAGGFCLRRDEEAGYCTAPCAAEASCAAAGFGHCAPSSRGDACQPSP